MYLIDFQEATFSRTLGARDKQSRKKRNIKQLLKNVAKVAATGTVIGAGGYGLYRGGKVAKRVGKSVAKNVNNDFIVPAKEIVENMRQASSRLKNISEDDINQLVKEARMGVKTSQDTLNSILNSVSNTSNKVNSVAGNIENVSDKVRMDIAATQTTMNNLNPFRNKQK